MIILAATVITCGWFKEVSPAPQPGNLGDYYSGAIYVCGGTVRGRYLYSGHRKFMAGKIDIAPEFRSW